MTANDSDNPWEAIRPDPDSDDDMRTRIDLMADVRATVMAWDVSQTVAAERLGLTQSQMNDLMQGHVDKFTLEDLMGLALETEMGVQVSLKKLNQTPNQ
jgi:predicted XRE-type DNA-binding protein